MRKFECSERAFVADISHDLREVANLLQDTKGIDGRLRRSSIPSLLRSLDSIKERIEQLKEHQS